MRAINRASAQFRYPRAEFDRFAPDEGSLNTFGFEQKMRLTGTLPTGGWAHLAIQVLATGYAELVLNRRVVAKSVMRYPDAARTTWHACMFEASVDTQLLVRELRVFRGARYRPRDGQPAR